MFQNQFEKVVNRQKKDKSIKRYSRKPVSYKITNEQVKYALTY